MMMPGTAGAQNYDLNIAAAGDAVAIQQDMPRYPGGSVRSGQEGWVRMSFVVSAEGLAIEPIILDSSGGGGFETEARKVVDSWLFEKPESGIESPLNFVDIRWEIDGGRDAATSNFMRRTRLIMTDLQYESIESARKRADNAHRTGGWNLYESTMLWLLLGRVAGAENDSAAKLEMYLRALAMGNSNSIPDDSRIELLEKIFSLQADFSHYAAAAKTAMAMRKLEGSADAAVRIAKASKTIDAALDGDAPLVAQATITNACDCDEGKPLWTYAPVRRTISFANLRGNVERFEARCKAGRIVANVDITRSWSLDPEWGACRVFVFGDDGAAFDFLEHASSASVPDSTA